MWKALTSAWHLLEIHKTTTKQSYIETTLASVCRQSQWTEQVARATLVKVATVLVKWCDLHSSKSVNGLVYLISSFYQIKVWSSSRNNFVSLRLTWLFNILPLLVLYTLISVSYTHLHFMNHPSWLTLEKLERRSKRLGATHIYKK